MATPIVSKAAKAKRPAGKTIIPKCDLKAVTQFRGFMIAGGGKNVTNEQAYQLVLKERQELAAKAKEDAKEQEEWKQEARESAIETMQRGFMHLADVRDLLAQMEAGEQSIGGVDCTSETLATFARAALSDAATKIERALFDLGLPTGEKYGYFVPEFPEKPEVLEANHG